MARGTEASKGLSVVVGVGPPLGLPDLAQDHPKAAWIPVLNDAQEAFKRVLAEACDVGMGEFRGAVGGRGGPCSLRLNGG